MIDKGRRPLSILPAELRDHFDATSEASRRTRTIVVVLVVGSILTLAGLLNSLSNAWMLQRIRESRSEGSTYVLQKLGYLTANTAGDAGVLVTAEEMHAILQNEADRTHQGFEEILDTYRDHYKGFYGALVNTYAQTAYTIQLPFFGASFDMNDLGIVAGVGFIVVLVLLRYSLAREVSNLRLSFAAAEQQNRLRDFYLLLSMRQVLTIPPMPSTKRPGLVTIVPQLLCVLPIAVHLGIIGHDFATIGIGKAVSMTHTIVLYCANSACFIAILILTGMSLSMWRSIDREWGTRFAKIRDSIVE